jgi:exonuclease SbcD
LLENEKRKLLVYGIPYLDPFLSSGKLFIEPEDISKAKRSHDLVLGKALSNIKVKKTTIKHDFSIVMSHAWFTGAEPEGSELDITVGGIGYASTEHLKGFDYAALGHIHRPKIIEDNIRYSGSALPYSFGEEKSPKRTIIVDFSGKTPQYEEILNDNSPKLHELSASLDELMESPRFKEFEDCYLKINLLDKPEPNGAGKMLRQRFPKLVDLKTFVAEGVAADWHRVDDINELDLCCEFIDKTRQRPADEWEMEQIQIAIEMVRHGNVRDSDLDLEDGE